MNCFGNIIILSLFHHGFCIGRDMKTVLCSAVFHPLVEKGVLLGLNIMDQVALLVVDKTEKEGRKRTK